MAKVEIKEVELKGGFSVEESKKRGKVHVYDNQKAYLENLPEGITVDQVKAQNHYSGAYIKSCLNKTVALANEEFKKKEDLVTAKYPFGSNSNSSVTIAVHKSVKQIIPSTDGSSGVKHVNAPQIKIKVKQQFHGAPSSNQIKEIKEDIHNKFNK